MPTLTILLVNMFHSSKWQCLLLVFFFLFLPYTFLLLFGQWLQTKSHLSLFSWVNDTRLKAFLDLNHAPYKPKHRYWPGLLLLLHFALLLVFASNPQQDSKINLLAIPLGAGVLQLWTCGLQELVSRCTGRLLCSQLDHASWCHLLCQYFRRESACSGVHFCLHSTHYIHWDPCLPHLPPTETHQAVEEGT